MRGFRETQEMADRRDEVAAVGNVSTFLQRQTEVAAMCLVGSKKI